MAFTITGLNHLALIVEDIAIAKKWFVEFLGAKVVDDRGGLLLLRLGGDVLAIKTVDYAINKPEYGSLPPGFSTESQAHGWQALDHYGFYAASPAEVDELASQVSAWGGEVLKGPYDRSDGRSVYFRDPCGNVGEYFFYKPASTP